MDPIEINAGAYYLRALRADDRLDDRPRIVEGFTDPVFRDWSPGFTITDLTAAGQYVEHRAEQWADETRLSWAIAEPTTGLLLGEVGLKRLDLTAGTADASVWLHPDSRGKGIATECLGAIIRFGFGALDLREVYYRHAPGNDASAAIAERLGFTRNGTENHLVHWFKSA
ncbi:GNAT family N-acetyltransferase [Herbihabitans rhizosphaerae]|uniref:GNAT family N-acetyltransferase n=1 Tax=Herbihabitans rhizosphaerae TaxID=1872711 RepID=UPI00102B41AC|nr:GNAT family N-acetyltransferase [Herbihabitans rhizosphaerae]